MASHFQGFFLCWCSYFTSEGSQGVAGTHGLAQLENKEGKGEWFRWDGTLKTDLFQPLPWKGEGELHRAQLKLGGNPIFPELQQPLYHTPAFSSTLIKQFPPAAPHSSVHIPKPWSSRALRDPGNVLQAKTRLGTAPQNIPNILCKRCHNCR